MNKRSYIYYVMKSYKVQLLFKKSKSIFDLFNGVRVRKIDHFSLPLLLFRFIFRHKSPLTMNTIESHLKISPQSIL